MLEARRASQIDFAPDGTPIVVGNSNAGGLPLFSTIQVPLNSERLGFLSLAKDNGLLSGDVFVDAYNELVKLSLTGNEPSIITMAEYEAEILAKGKCGKFGLSIANKQFKIPFVPGVFLQSKESSADIGVWTPDQLQGHWHGDGTSSEWSAGSVGKVGNINATGNTLTNKVIPIRDVTTDGVNGIPRIGTKTKPESISVDYQMKLYGTLTNKAQVDMADIVNQLTGKLDTSVYSSNAWSIAKASARVAANGSITANTNIISCTRISTGQYQLTFMPGIFSNSNKMEAYITGYRTDTGGVGVGIDNITTSQIRVNIVNWSGVPADYPFNIRIYEGK